MIPNDRQIFKKAQGHLTQQALGPGKTGRTFETRLAAERGIENNKSEMGTREAAKGNRKVKDAKGPVSGDALKRATSGQPAKFDYGQEK
jgi:hypothetical protein